MPFNPNEPIARYDQISAERNINANSHPLARIAYTALNKVFQVRKAKSVALSTPMKVTRDHYFTHGPSQINISPKPTV